MGIEESKLNVLQRVVAGKNGVERYDIKIKSFLEYQDGVVVTFTVTGNDVEMEESIKWWDIIFSAQV